MIAATRRVWGAGVCCVLVALLLLSLALPVRAQEDASARLVALINQARLNEGLAPLWHSTLLTQAAQRHADDLVTLGTLTHEGPDGSTYPQRIRETRYQAWNDGLLVDELLWTGLGSASDALIWFHSNPEWGDLTDARYREVGIGYADDAGVHYFVVVLGARPGVLPVFINDGAAAVDLPQVAVRLTNEEAVPLGDAAWIGRAIEVRLSNAPEFEGIPWQPWEPLLPWELAGEEPGDYAVYVQYRDGAGRTAIAEDTVRLVPPGDVPPNPTALLDLPEVTTMPAAELPETSETEGALDMPTPSPEGALTPEVGVTEIAVSLTPFPTWTPLAEEVMDEPQAKPVDWPLLLAILLQALALCLGFLSFLRRAR